MRPCRARARRRRTVRPRVRSPVAGTPGDAAARHREVEPARDGRQARTAPARLGTAATHPGRNRAGRPLRPDRQRRAPVAEEPSRSFDHGCRGARGRPRAPAHGGNRLLAARVAFAPVVQGFEVATAAMIMKAPKMLAAVHLPVLLALQAGVGIALLGVRLVLRLITRLVELDASFCRALPIMERAASSRSATCRARAPSGARQLSPTQPRHSCRW